jgi:hypothetical protein
VESTDACRMRHPKRRESCHASLLGEDPGMASTSKGRASSRKQSRAGKARVISTKRKDALPRTGSVSAGRRKPVVLPPIDALTEPLATAVASPKKKAHSLHQNETTASRKKRRRAAGLEALAFVETVWEVEASAIVEEFPVEAVTAPSIAFGPPPIPEATRAPPPARTTAQSFAPAAPAPYRERRSLMPAIGRLLSTLYRWTGVSGTK